MDTEKEKAYEKLIAAQNNLKLVETENKITQQKIQPALDIIISKTNVLDKFEQHTTHRVTNSHKTDTEKNSSQYLRYLHCVKSVCIRSYSGPYLSVFSPKREDLDQNNSEYGHFSSSAFDNKKLESFTYHIHLHAMTP